MLTGMAVFFRCFQLMAFVVPRSVGASNSVSKIVRKRCSTSSSRKAVSAA
jgi:hypothetical protein